MDLSGDLVRALGALFTGLGGFLFGWAAMRRSHYEGRKECEEAHDSVAPPL